MSLPDASMDSRYCRAEATDSTCTNALVVVMLWAADALVCPIRLAGESRYPVFESKVDSGSSPE